MSFGSDQFGELIFGDLGQAGTVATWISTEINWDIQKGIAKSLDISYDVRSKVVKNLGIAYAIEVTELTSKSVQVNYDIHKTITKLVNVTWDIDPTLTSSNEGNNHCLPPVDRNRTFCL